MCFAVIQRTFYDNSLQMRNDITSNLEVGQSVGSVESLIVTVKTCVMIKRNQLEVGSINCEVKRKD